VSSSSVILTSFGCCNRGHKSNENLPTSNSQSVANESTADASRKQQSSKGSSRYMNERGRERGASTGWSPGTFPHAIKTVRIGADTHMAGKDRDCIDLQGKERQKISRLPTAMYRARVFQPRCWKLERDSKIEREASTVYSDQHVSSSLSHVTNVHSFTRSHQLSRCLSPVRRIYLDLHTATLLIMQVGLASRIEHEPKMRLYCITRYSAERLQTLRAGRLC